MFYWYQQVFYEFIFFIIFELSKYYSLKSKEPYHSKDYLFYLKNQLQLYGLFILTASSSYGIILYFFGGDPLPVDPDHIIGFVTYSLAYVCGGAYIYKHCDSQKKRIKNFHSKPIMTIQEVNEIANN
jgi:hypothetical protein